MGTLRQIMFWEMWHPLDRKLWFKKPCEMFLRWHSKLPHNTPLLSPSLSIYGDLTALPAPPDVLPIPPHFLSQMFPLKDILLPLISSGLLLLGRPRPVKASYICLCFTVYKAILHKVTVLSLVALWHKQGRYNYTQFTSLEMGAQRVQCWVYDRQPLRWLDNPCLLVLKPCVFFTHNPFACGLHYWMTSNE